MCPYLRFVVQYSICTLNVPLQQFLLVIICVPHLIDYEVQHRAHMKRCHFNQFKKNLLSFLCGISLFFYSPVFELCLAFLYFSTSLSLSLSLSLFP